MPLIGALCLGFALAGCKVSESSASLPPAGLKLTEVASGLSSPLYLTAPPGDARLFIVEQPGRIRIVQSGTLLPTPFLDIAAKISCCGERGLLSVAFHPQYASNGYLYVNYTDLQGNTRIERYTVSSNANVATLTSAKLILAIDQPYANHNGGLNMFGPDGMLYIGMGDGGAGGDPHNYGQSLSTLLGKMLRIDVDHGDPYAIPSNNPYSGSAASRGEIWAYGLRNPWRFAFDRPSGTLYIADVGQNAIEEINAVPASQANVNYGWRIMEGSRCYAASTCGQTGLVLPVVEYDHSQGCSVTGGFVYRGRAMSALAGHYFYSDYCDGWLRSFKYANGTVTDRKDWGLGQIGSVLSFGEDSSGELYMLLSNGRVLRLDSA